MGHGESVPSGPRDHEALLLPLGMRVSRAGLSGASIKPGTGHRAYLPSCSSRYEHASLEVTGNCQ